VGIREQGIAVTIFFQLKNCKHKSFGRFVDVRVGVVYSRNKLALHTKLRNLNLKS